MIVESIRQWARGHTRERRYSPVGITFHWSMAALILFQLWWGWRIGRLPVGPEKLDAYALHSQVGLLVFLLALLRMAWRMMIPGPVNDADKPGWQSVAAHVTHYAFYVCLVGLPLSGWTMLSATASEQPLSVAGILPWPHLPFAALTPEQRWTIEAWAELIHFGFVIAIVLLIALHAGAAIKHEMFNQDDVLDGMLPALPTLQRWVGSVRRRIARPLRSPQVSADG